VSERTPFPEIDTTEGTGYDWLGRFMEAQALLAANALFAAFKLGQIGVAGRFDADLARGMVADLKTDRIDLAFAAKQLDKVIESLIANIEGNLPK
jgi:hypothetical protein